MRQLQPKYSDEILRSTKVIALVLGIGSLVFVGAVCAKPVLTNTNAGLNSNTNANSSISNGNENTNSSEIDTSDWLTYTNDEYGFSFRYPNDAKLVENENNLPYPGISFLSDITVDNTKQEDLQGVTLAFSLTDLDLTTLTQKIEQSDTSRGVTLAKVGSIQEGTLNQFAVYQGSHATAIGIPTDFYYVPLKSNFALFIFYNNDKNNVNSNIINTLSVEN